MMITVNDIRRIAREYWEYRELPVAVRKLPDGDYRVRLYLKTERHLELELDSLRGFVRNVLPRHNIITQGMLLGKGTVKRSGYGRPYVQVEFHA